MVLLQSDGMKYRIAKITMDWALKQFVLFCLNTFYYHVGFMYLFTERNIYSNVDFETFRLFTQGNATLANDLYFPETFPAVKNVFVQFI